MRDFSEINIYLKKNCAVSVVTLSASARPVAVEASSTHMNRWLSYRIAHRSSLFELLKLREWERYVWEHFRISDVITLEKINVFCTYDTCNKNWYHQHLLEIWALLSCSVYMLLLEWIQLYRLTEITQFHSWVLDCMLVLVFLLWIVSSLHLTWTSTLTVDCYRE